MIIANQDGEGTENYSGRFEYRCGAIENISRYVLMMKRYPMDEFPTERDCGNVIASAKNFIHAGTNYLRPIIMTRSRTRHRVIINASQLTA